MYVYFTARIKFDATNVRWECLFERAKNAFENKCLRIQERSLL